MVASSSSKGIIAWILALIMLFFVGCGKDQGTEKKKKEAEADKIDVSEVKSLEDAFNKLSDYSTGTYELSIKLDAPEEYADDASRNIHGWLKVNGECDGNDQTAALSFGGSLSSVNVEKDYGKFLTLKENVLYVDLDKLANAYSDIDSDFGNFGFILPEINEEKLDAAGKKYCDLFTGFMTAAAEGLDEAEGTKFSVKLSSVDDYKKLAGNVIGWLEDNQSKIKDAAKNASEIREIVDVEKYFNSLVDEYYDDVYDSLKYLSETDIPEKFDLEIDENLDANIEEEGLTKEDVRAELAESADYFYEYFDDMAESAEAEDDEDIISELKEIYQESLDDGTWEDDLGFLDKTDITISLELSEDGYEFKAYGVVADDDYELNLDASFKFTLGAVSIDKPDNVKKISEIVKYCCENRDMMKQFADDFKQPGNSPVFGRYLYGIEMSALSNDSYMLERIMNSSAEALYYSSHANDMMMNGSRLYVEINDGEVTLRSDYEDFTSDWATRSWLDAEDKLSSQSVKGLSDTITGVIVNDGERKGILWKAADGDVIKAIVDAYEYSNLGDLLSSEGFFVDLYSSGIYPEYNEPSPEQGGTEDKPQTVTGGIPAGDGEEEMVFDAGKVIFTYDCDRFVMLENNNVDTLPEKEFVFCFDNGLGIKDVPNVQVLFYDGVSLDDFKTDALEREGIIKTSEHADIQGRKAIHHTYLAELNEEELGPECYIIGLDEIGGTMAIVFGPELIEKDWEFISEQFVSGTSFIKA